MSQLRQERSRPLMLSKRACVFYLEKVRVVLKDDRIVYLTENSQPVEYFYNIPEKTPPFTTWQRQLINRCGCQTFSGI